MIDSTTYFLAYFYPRVAVYDDYSGWDRMNFMDSHEFYSDFNDYDVTINVPKNYIVWGTGTLQQPEKLLQPAVLQRYNVRQVPYVPDAGHSKLIERVLGSDTMRGIPLTTEEEGVALVAGAWAGGQRCALLMQSSGVGNCINMFSLIPLFRLPFFTIVTMRGEWGEFNHWQVPMGSTTQAVFELSGIRVMRAHHAGEVREVVEAGAAQAYNACTPTAVLLSQRLIGAKVFVK